MATASTPLSAPLGLYVGISSFAQLEARIAALPREQRGPAFEPFARAFLLLTPELELEAVWRPEDSTLPPSILSTLGLRPDDRGADFIARRRDGTLWAVQAKFRSHHPTVTAEDLDRLLAAGQKADHRLFVGNYGGFSPKTPPWILQPGARFGAVLREELLALPPEFFARWAALEDQNQVRPLARHAPRVDQLQALDAIAAHFADGTSRGQLIAACGTGKTLLALWTAERLQAQRVLYCAPSLALVQQTLSEWKRHAAGAFEAFCVCSDETVAGDARPFELAVPVSTDVATTAAFWERESTCPKVLFATYQSLGVLQHALKGLPPPDLVIADEAHHIAGPAGKRFQAVLDDGYLPARRRLFMTATPRIAAGRSTGGDTLLAASMDDEALFGRRAFELPCRAAIEAGLLADYQVDILVTTDAEVRELVERRVLVDAGGRRVTTETLAQAVALVKATQAGLFSRAFSFHRTRASAVAFLDAVKHVGSALEVEIATASIFGDQAVAVRKAVLRQTCAAERAAVSSARALGEGVDAPAVDGVVFADPKSSVVDIVQAIGRAVRLDPKKPQKRAHIIVPIVIAQGDAPEAATQLPSWSGVWHVLRALRAHDVHLADVFDTALRELGRRRAFDPDLFGGRLHVVLPSGIPLARFCDAITLQAVREVGDPFAYAWGVLQAFHARTGDARVPHRYREQCGFPLARWVIHQRTKYRLGLLAAEHVKALESLPGWSWSPFEEDWLEGLQTLRTFHARTGHTRVPQTWTENGFPLGRWTTRRRGEYRRGRLASERVKALESLPGWSWDTRADLWRSGLQALSAFHARTGHTRVPQTWTENGFPLGVWVARRRAEFHRGLLAPERVQALEVLEDWSWAPFKDDWAKGLRLARLFEHREGHACIPRTCVEQGFPLGAWATHQRTLYRRGRLAPARQRALERLTGWPWDDPRRGRQRLDAAGAASDGCDMTTNVTGGSR